MLEERQIVLQALSVGVKGLLNDMALIKLPATDGEKTLGGEMEVDRDVIPRSRRGRGRARA